MVAASSNCSALPDSVDNRLTVLIAEDSPADRMLLSTIVSRQGHRVLTASNGLEAVQRCAELAQSGDAVLLSPACASLDMFKNFEERGARFASLVEAL